MRPVLLLVGSVCMMTLAKPACADDDANVLFSDATKALHEGRPGDAIASLESLADRGVVDPVASYDRGLAYAMRVRIGAEVPGDLGRAAHGFEEARELSSDSRLADDASRGLIVVRSEIARRRNRAGQPAEVDPGRSLARTLARLLSESAWETLAVVSSLALTLGLFALWLAHGRRVRIAGAIAASVAAAALAASVSMTLSSKRDRQTLVEAVVVTGSARPSDERGMSLPGATPLPEGARVEVVEARGAWTRVRFGTVDAWVASDSLRDLSRPG